HPERSHLVQGHRLPPIQDLLLQTVLNFPVSLAIMNCGHHRNCPATESVALASGQGAVGPPPTEGPVVSFTPGADNLAERTRRRGRPRREAKTLSGLHQKFLLYCEVERRLSPQTVTSYRSDFRQFTEFLRSRSRWGLVSQDVLGALSMGNVR